MSNTWTDQLPVGPEVDIMKYWGKFMAVPVTVFVDIIFSIVFIILKGQYFIHENNNENREKIFHS